jgi:phenylalanyl-tRNA synthetase beta chain
MPAAVQDIALVVDQKVTAAELTQALRAGAGELLESIELFDRYDKLGDGKVSLAFTLTFRASDRTLKTEEVSAAREAAAAEAAKRCGATVRA